MVQEIQQATGLTLRRIAQFLHIDSGWLSKYVRNERNLPIQTTLTLIDLFKFVQEAKPGALPAQDEKQKETWAVEAKIKRYEAKATEKEWLQMQAACTAALRLKQLAQVLPQKMPLTPRQIRWADEQIYQADKAINNKGRVPQQNLYVKWQLLIKEAELLEAAAKDE